MADAVCVFAQDRVDNNVLFKVKEMMKKLKTVNQFLHGELVAKRAAHAPALIDIIYLQRERKKAIEEKKGTPRLLAAEKTKKESSAVVEQICQNSLTVTMKVFK